jgi:hypothetical protein
VAVSPPAIVISLERGGVGSLEVEAGCWDGDRISGELEGGEEDADADADGEGEGVSGGFCSSPVRAKARDRGSK